MAYDAILAETVMITGNDDDRIEAYAARPLDGRARGGVVVIHHLPGYDDPTKEITRRFAVEGYNAVMPNLYWREAPGAAPDDAAAAARAAGGVADAQVVGDLDGAMTWLRELGNSNGKVATIGFCSGGRHSWLAAGSLALDAAILCYPGFVVGDVPDQMPPTIRPIPELAATISGPLLGLFGNDDSYPSPAHVTEIRELLEQHGKPHDFHSYDGAGHAFFAVNRASYRPEAAVDGWAKIFAFLGTHLAAEAMCTYQTETLAVAGSAKGPGDWLRVTDATVYVDHPVHAMPAHTVNVDLRNPAQGPGARVALELHPEAARALAESILRSLDAAPEGVLAAG